MYNVNLILRLIFFNLYLKFGKKKILIIINKTRIIGVKNSNLNTTTVFENKLIM